jgi:hypothetical protein
MAIINVDSLEKAPQLKRNTNPPPPVAPEGSPDELSSSVGWAKGTGYGTGRSSSGWNPEDHIRAKKEKDRQVTFIMYSVRSQCVARKINCISILLFAGLVCTIASVSVIFAAVILISCAFRFYESWKDCCKL